MTPEEWRVAVESGFQILPFHIQERFTAIKSCEFGVDNARCDNQTPAISTKLWIPTISTTIPTKFHFPHQYPQSLILGSSST